MDDVAGGRQRIIAIIRDELRAGKWTTDPVATGYEFMQPVRVDVLAGALADALYKRDALK